MDSTTDGFLLIEGDLTTATTILVALSAPDRPRVDWVTTLAEGRRRMEHPGETGVILDLFLPDSSGLDTLVQARATAAHIPILVLCGALQEPLGRLAVEHGAYDFLLRDHLDRYALTRATRHMLEASEGEDALFIEKNRAEVTLDSIGDAVLSTDIAGNIAYLNAVAECMTGWSRSTAIGRPLAEVFNIIDGETREPAANPMTLAVRRNATVGLTPNCILIRRDGYESPIEDSAAPIHDRRGHVTGAVIVFRDVSAARQRSMQLWHLAQHDALTDLPNRILLRDRLQQAILLARRHKRRIAVVFIDLDRFKAVNDSLGHEIGDQLLQEVSARLKRSVRRSDTVGRQGGDEFLAILTEVDTMESAVTSAAKVFRALTVPYYIAAHELQMTVSMGVSVFPDDAADADTLVQHADEAMYHTKDGGRRNYHFYRPDMAARVAKAYRSTAAGPARRPAD